MGRKNHTSKPVLGGSFSLCPNFEDNAVLVAGQTRCLEAEPAKLANSGRCLSLGKLINSINFGLVILPYFWRGLSPPLFCLSLAFLIAEQG